MSRFHLELTGYVGRDNFNSGKTLNVLNQYPGKHVDVLIDSQGGHLVHGLSIADAFRSHGDVTAHIRGMCASAATIASMGAKKVTMAPDAFYLVHQVMMTFFDWSSHNADSLEQYIEALKKQKQDLETLDSSVAATYASRCKKPVNQLIDLMKEGKWLTAQQALEWGFVDEITAPSENSMEQPRMTRAQACAFEAQGLPLPPLELEPENEGKGFFKELRSLFKTFSPMNQNPNNSQSPEQQTDPKTDPAPQNDLQAEIDRLKAEKDDLQAKYDALAKKPAEETSSVVTTPPAEEPKNEADPIADFLAVGKTASDLFNSLP